MSWHTLPNGKVVLGPHKCPRCGERKRSAFGKSAARLSGLQTYCKVCTRNKLREERRLGNRGGYVAGRKYYMKWKYGMTDADYSRMLHKQKSRCAICGRHASKVPLPPGGPLTVNKHLKPKKKFGLCVDHDHKRNVVRGLLCNSCNRGLGFLGEDLKTLRAAVRYMRRALNLRRRRRAS